MTKQEQERTWPPGEKSPNFPWVKGTGRYTMDSTGNTVAVSYGSSLVATEQIIRESVNAFQHANGPPGEVMEALTELADEVQCREFADLDGDDYNELKRLAIEALRLAGVEVPDEH